MRQDASAEIPLVRADVPERRHGDRPLGRELAFGVGSAAWVRWLGSPDAAAFRYEGVTGSFTARRERRRGGWFWYAYRKAGGRLRKAYLGTAVAMTAERLTGVAATLAAPIAAGAAPQVRPTPTPLSHVGAPPRSQRLAPATSFVGRRRETLAVEHLLRRARIVTMTGPPGVGKTRLALHVAARAAARHAGPVRVVELSLFHRPERVLPAVAAAFGVWEAEGQPALERIAQALGAAPLLLVLDNFEQVLPAAGTLTDLVRACSGLRILVTSRAVLRVEPEHEFVVPPLGVPDPMAADSAAFGASPEVATAPAAVMADAVRLFVDRARARDPGFALDEASAPAVAEICRRLDGLPLAIELAAARIKVLPPQAMLSRLTHRLHVLTGGARDLPARQRTLRAAVAWSYHLLDAEEREVLCALAVFAGGCTLTSLAAVAGAPGSRRLPTPEVDPASREHRNGQPPPAPLESPAPLRTAAVTEGVGREAEVWVLGPLGRLLDQSLVQREPGAGDGQRFRLLETVREFAQERLEANDEAAVRRRHAAHFLALAEEAEVQLTRSAQSAWLNRLEQEHANLREAVAWLVENGETEQVLRLGGALMRFWMVHGHLLEGLGWLEPALARGAAQAAITGEVRAKALLAAGTAAFFGLRDYPRAVALYEESLALRRGLGASAPLVVSLIHLGVVARTQGDYPRAKALFEESLALARPAGDSFLHSSALANLGWVAHLQGDFARARVLHEECLAIRRTTHDEWGLTGSLNSLGYVALREGDLRRAETLHRHSLALRRTMQDKRGIATSLRNLGAVARHRGAYARAASRYRESLMLWQQLGDRSGAASCVEGIAALAAARGRATRAAHLFGAAEAAFEAIGAPLAPADRADYDHSVGTARARLSPPAFSEAWRTGRETPLARAVADALELATQLGGADAAGAVSTAGPTHAVGAQLSPREREVATLVAQGLTNREIALQLVITPRTAETHVDHILAKLDLKGRAQIAAVWATRTTGIAAVAKGAAPARLSPPRRIPRSPDGGAARAR